MTEGTGQFGVTIRVHPRQPIEHAKRDLAYRLTRHLAERIVPGTYYSFVWHVETREVREPWGETMTELTGRGELREVETIRQRMRIIEPRDLSIQPLPEIGKMATRELWDRFKGIFKRKK